MEVLEWDGYQWADDRERYAGEFKPKHRNRNRTKLVNALLIEASFQREFLLSGFRLWWSVDGWMNPRDRSRVHVMSWDRGREP